MTGLKNQKLDFTYLANIKDEMLHFGLKKTVGVTKI